MNAGAVVGGVAAGIGAAVGIGGLIYRQHSRSEANRVPQYEQQLEQRQQQLQGARDALVVGQPGDPDMDVETARRTAHERFDGAHLLVARNDDGDSKRAAVAQVLDAPHRNAQDASNAATALSGGRATAVAKVGQHYFGLVLNDALTPVEHTRTEYYTETEYGYAYGYDPVEDEYGYHWGPQTVQRSRQVDYLSDFDRYVPARGGISEARTGARDLMRNEGTALEQGVGAAQQGVTAAQADLSNAQRHATKQSPGFVPMAIGGGIAGVGIAALAVSLLRAAR